MNDNDDDIRHIYTYRYERAIALLPTPQQAAALKVIREHRKPMRAVDIGAALGIERKHANVLLRGLLLNKYIRREGHPRAGTTGGFEYRYEVN